MNQSMVTVRTEARASRCRCTTAQLSTALSQFPPHLQHNCPKPWDQPTLSRELRMVLLSSATSEREQPARETLMLHSTSQPPSSVRSYSSVAITVTQSPHP